MSGPAISATDSADSRMAMRFVLLIGVLSFFADFTYEGARSVLGPYPRITARNFGYALQMASVPTLALTGSWQAAAVLIILERVGRAIRNPSRDTMLSHAAKNIGGYGWAFGIHEACDQFGAMLGPLLVAVVLAHHGS
jgi:hypothetical protein